MMLHSRSEWAGPGLTARTTSSLSLRAEQNSDNRDNSGARLELVGAFDPRVS